MFSHAQKSSNSTQSKAATVQNQSKGQKPAIQTKLKIGQPNDKHEQQADRIADRVVSQSTPTQQVQTKCNACDAEEKIQKMGDEEEVQAKLFSGVSIQRSNEEEDVQAKTEGGKQPVASQAVTDGINGSRGSGAPLPADIRTQMETGIGADFSKVRIHTDSRAAKMNQELQARAFTTGSDVFFNKGQYNPTSNSGKHLLAHELTHVVQQQPNTIQKQEENEEETQEVVNETHLGRVHIELMGRNQEEAIALMQDLNQAEAEELLSRNSVRATAVRAFNNEEMFKAMNEMKGPLAAKLRWVFAEGTDYEKLKVLIASNPDSRAPVCEDEELMGEFVWECNDEQILDLVEDLGCNPMQKARWMIAEGVSAEALANRLFPRSKLSEPTELKLILNSLPVGYRDNVAGHFVDSITEADIQTLGTSHEGQALLAMLVISLMDGRWVGGAEDDKMELIMKNVPAHGQSEMDQTVAADDAFEQQSDGLQDEAMELTNKHYEYTVEGYPVIQLDTLSQELKTLLSGGQYHLVSKVVRMQATGDLDDNLIIRIFEQGSGFDEDLINTLIADETGKKLLLDFVQVLYSGDKNDRERKLMQQIMTAISAMELQGNPHPEVEVLTFTHGGAVLDAIGAGYNQGTQGHTAVAVGNYIYSFEAGWSCGYTRSEYLAKKRAGEISAIGQVLNTDPQSAQEIQAYLNSQCGEGVYLINSGGQICTGNASMALKSGLEEFESARSVFRLTRNLEAAGLVRTYRFYPQSGLESAE